MLFDKNFAILCAIDRSQEFGIMCKAIFMDSIGLEKVVITM